MSSRWIQALLIAILGLAVGLFYGWRIAPVEYVNTTPDTLHQEYKSEYTLMVAEAYLDHGDLDLAARQLALLGSAHPADIIQNSLDSDEYTDDEIELLSVLLDEMKAWQPSLGESGS